VMIVPANSQLVRVDACSGGSPCRHQWPELGAALAGIAVAAIAATTISAIAAALRRMGNCGIFTASAGVRSRTGFYPGGHNSDVTPLLR
jgi:hypothetical protein